MSSLFWWRFLVWCTSSGRGLLVPPSGRVSWTHYPFFFLLLQSCFFRLSSVFVGSASFVGESKNPPLRPESSFPRFPINPMSFPFDFLDRIFFFSSPERRPNTTFFWCAWIDSCSLTMPFFIPRLVFLFSRLNGAPVIRRLYPFGSLQLAL